ncbi:MAG: sterol desaturase family protein [Deltaproteobacteria bacterium]|nr:sterol desaturase family protein [Deltaproteobacteria bacterium]
MLLAVAIWEMVAAKRQLTVPKAGRWFNNLGLIALDNILVKILFPGAAIGVAAAAAKNGWGLCNYFSLPQWAAILLSVLLLDLIIYLQHLMFHAVPLLWRLHMVHHADLDIDVTTGLRFHPIEIIISMLIKMAAISFLGPPVAAVLIFEITLNATAMFNHGNIRLPVALDRLLRLLVVTPDMHRVHHSVIIRETDSNFGFNFPWWDRLFGTYRAQPVRGHQKMAIGLSQFRRKEKLTLPRLLLMPFIDNPGRYSLQFIGGDPDTIRKEDSGH